MAAAWLLPAPRALAADAPDVTMPDVTITNYGNFTAHETRIESDPSATNRARGYFDAYTFLDTTRDICAKLGVQYGFEMQQGAKTAGTVWPLDVVIDHPPVVGMDGTIHRHERYATKLGDAPLVFGWIYQHTNTLVDGDWTWTVTYQGVVVTRQVFHLHTDCAVPVA